MRCSVWGSGATVFAVTWGRGGGGGEVVLGVALAFCGHTLA